MLVCQNLECSVTLLCLAIEFIVLSYKSKLREECGAYHQFRRFKKTGNILLAPGLRRGGQSVPGPIFFCWFLASAPKVHMSICICLPNPNQKGCHSCNRDPFHLHQYYGLWSEISFQMKIFSGVSSKIPNSLLAWT